MPYLTTQYCGVLRTSRKAAPEPMSTRQASCWEDDGVVPISLMRVVECILGHVHDGFEVDVEDLQVWFCWLLIIT